MIVYRIQDRDGRGPFKPGFSVRWLDPVKPNHEFLVSWIAEFPQLPFRIHKFRIVYCGCGCSSPEQLRMWFSRDEVKRLKQFGYNPVMFEPDAILAQSKIQVVFRRIHPLNQNVVPFSLYPE